ncbi:MAG: hypothetical protein MJ209_01185 [archaeon]|nr:hypothetical protein [archaeon]
MDYITKDCFINSKRQNDFPYNDIEALALSSIKFAKEGQTYIYAPKKKEITKLSKTIIKIMKIINPKCYDFTLNISSDDEDIIYLKKVINEELGEKSELMTYLNYGFLIHHADLPDRVKIHIEQALKNKKIKLIIATSTLVQGVNFPFKTIIFKGLYIKNLIDYSTFFNICGRVGRATEKNNGQVLLFLGIMEKKNYKKKIKLRSTFRKFFENDSYQLKSIIEPLLKKIKKQYKATTYSIEEYCLKLIDNIDISEVFNYEEIMNINEIDTQLLAFIEEEDDELKILENFINVSLHHVQFKKKEEQVCLKGFINSRLTYLKKEFNETSVRSRAYNMGLSLKDCKYIENNYDKLKNLFLQSKDWDEFQNHEKSDLLLKIALEMLELDTLYYEDEIDRKNKILREWIANTPILNIADEALTESEVNKFINFCRTMIPWAITSILNFFRLKEPKIQIPKICEYFSEMFKYGIFNLKIVILMPWANNNYEFCKKLSKHIEKEELNFNKLHLELESLYDKLQSEWSKEEMKEFEKYLNPFSHEYEETMETIITLEDNIRINSGEYIYILNNLNNISLYDLEGNYIINVDYENINIENIWKIKTLENNKLILKLL